MQIIATIGKKMQINSTPATPVNQLAPLQTSDPPLLDVNSAQPDQLKEAFHDFVGQTFFGELMKAFRSTQQPSAYFHGGRAEEIFQGQLDQVLAEKLSDASADRIADPMFELFMLKRTP